MPPRKNHNNNPLGLTSAAVLTANPPQLPLRAMSPFDCGSLLDDEEDDDDDDDYYPDNESSSSESTSALFTNTAARISANQPALGPELALGDQLNIADQWLQLGPAPNPMMVDAVVALAKAKAEANVQMHDALVAGGKRLITERSRKLKPGDVVVGIGRFREKVRGLCVGPNGELGPFVPSSPLFSHWDLHVDNLPATDRRDLPAPSDAAWAQAAAAFFDGEVAKATGKSAGHIQFRRARAIIDEFMKRPQEEVGALKDANAQAQLMEGLFEVAPYYQRANQVGGDLQMDLARSGIARAKLSNEILQVAGEIMTGGGDINENLTAGNFSRAAAALRHTRTSSAAVAPLCISSGSEAALAAVGIALAAVDLAAPGIWPWGGLPEAKKVEALSVAAGGQDSNERAAKLQKLDPTQMQFLVMKLAEEAQAGRA